MPGFPEDIVRSHLAGIESESGAKILYAVESGSRAWGFASPDSDFDIRFIYQESPADLLGLHPPRDVIERMIEPENSGLDVPVDLVGWSLRKALVLAERSNPQIFEWARGPITYYADAAFGKDMDLLSQQADPFSLVNHYRGLTTRTVKEHLERGDDPVAKKYLYAVRAALAANWIIDQPGSGAVPPVRFASLLGESDVPTAVRSQIEELLDLKSRTGEAAARRRFVDIDRWLESVIEKNRGISKIIERHPVDRQMIESIWQRNLPEELRYALRCEDVRPGREPALTSGPAW